MNCSNCGFLNNPNAKFCVKCGQSLENVNGGNGSQDVLVNNAVQTLEMQNNSMNSNVSSSISNVTASGTLNQTVHVNQKKFCDKLFLCYFSCDNKTIYNF